MRVSLQPAFVIHKRAYRETSLLLDVFTEAHGMVSLVAKGVRVPRSKTQGLLQPFVPLYLSWTGRSELKLLTAVESRDTLQALSGHALYSGFYLNELIMALLQKEDPHPVLFVAYDNAIHALQSRGLKEPVLRQFEFVLLRECGYGVFTDDAHDDLFSDDQFYYFAPDDGFLPIHPDEAARINITCFLGKTLQAIARSDWQEETVLQDAKKLTRLLLAPLLGKKKINSRYLFV